MRPALKCGLYTWWKAVGENQVFPCEQFSTGDSSLVGEWCPSPLLSSETPSVLDLYRPFVCCHHLYEFICDPVLLCMWGIISLVPNIPNESYNLSVFSSANFPELWVEKFDGDIPFSTWCSKVYHSLHIFQLCDLHVRSNILQLDASPMMAEQDIDVG